MRSLKMINVSFRQRPRVQCGNDSEAPTNGAPVITAAARAIKALCAMPISARPLLEHRSCDPSTFVVGSDATHLNAESKDYVLVRPPTLLPSSAFWSTCNPETRPCCSRALVRRHLPAQRTGHAFGIRRLRDRRRLGAVLPGRVRQRRRATSAFGAWPTSGGALPDAGRARATGKESFRSFQTYRVFHPCTCLRFVFLGL
ncbi:hypothetical protein B0H17DRAFT_1203841 [Mycena rosella]|uniref:Uncharacterized protein n=1 Tax=Mycena rosella TaxID=1033263 RepID=A0AAD7DAZ5_MYCRO|nr:hypothetical protein B0H17DRAFT_1203841 [Mycena rosella]